MKATVLLAALMGMAVSALKAPVNTIFSRAGSRSKVHRSRQKGEPGESGDKLAKLAAKGRIGVCHK